MSEWPANVASGISAVTIVVLANLVRKYVAAQTVEAAQGGHFDAFMPKVMAGRYAFMGLLVAVFVVLQDFRSLAIVFSGFAFLGIIDALIYSGKHETRPHTMAALLSVIGAGSCGLVQYMGK